jgi:hypothetical protein
MSFLRTLVLAGVGLTVTASIAVAQPLGTFRWQIQPHCNVLTINVTQQAGLYTLDGTDDRCGEAQAASVVGIAFLNPNLQVGFGLTVVLPGGGPVHIEATIDMSSLSGSWRDSAGNSGAFVFTPGPGIGGTQRLVPPGGLAANSVAAVHILPGAVGASALAPDAVSGNNIVDLSITTRDILDPPGVEFGIIRGDQEETFELDVDKVVNHVTLTAPRPGRVVVNASGTFEFASNQVDIARCEITTSNELGLTHVIEAGDTATNSIKFLPFAGTRGFDVSPGPNRFNLVCDVVSGMVKLRDSSLTAIFVSNPNQ